MKKILRKIIAIGLSTTVLINNFQDIDHKFSIRASANNKIELTDDSINELKNFFLVSGNQRLEGFAQHSRFLEFIKFVIEYLDFDFEKIKSNLSNSDNTMNNFLIDLNSDEDFEKIVCPFYTIIQRNKNDLFCKKIIERWNQDASEFTSKVLFLTEYSLRQTVDYDYQFQQSEFQKLKKDFFEIELKISKIQNLTKTIDKFQEENAESKKKAEKLIKNKSIKEFLNFTKVRKKFEDLINDEYTQILLNADDQYLLSLMNDYSNDFVNFIHDLNSKFSEIILELNSKKIANEAAIKLYFIVDKIAKNQDKDQDIIFFGNDLIRLSALKQEGLVKDFFNEARYGQEICFQLKDVINMQVQKDNLESIGVDDKNIVCDKKIGNRFFSTFSVLIEKYDYLKSYLRTEIYRIIDSKHESSLSSIGKCFNSREKAINALKDFSEEELTKLLKENTDFFARIIISSIFKNSEYTDDTVCKFDKMGLLKPVLLEEKENLFLLIKNNILCEENIERYSIETIKIICNYLPENEEKDRISNFLKQNIMNKITSCEDCLEYIKKEYKLSDETDKNFLNSLLGFKNAFYNNFDVKKINIEDFSSEDAAKVIEILFMCDHQLSSKNNKFIEFLKKMQSEGFIQKFSKESNSTAYFDQIKIDPNNQKIDNENKERLFSFFSCIKFNKINQNLNFDIFNKNIKFGQLFLKREEPFDPSNEKLSNIKNFYGTYFCKDTFLKNGVEYKHNQKIIFESFLKSLAGDSNIISSYIFSAHKDLIKEASSQRLFKKPILTRVFFSDFVPTISNSNSSLCYLATFKEVQERLKNDQDFKQKPITESEYFNFIKIISPLFYTLRFSDFINKEDTMRQLEVLNKEMLSRISIESINQVFEILYGHFSSENTKINPRKNFMNGGIKGLSINQSRKKHSAIFQNLMHMTIMTKEEWNTTPFERMCFEFSDEKNLNEVTCNGDKYYLCGKLVANNSDGRYIYEGKHANSSHIGFSVIDNADDDVGDVMGANKRLRVISHALESIKSLESDSGRINSCPMFLYKDRNISFTNYVFFRINELMCELKTKGVSEERQTKITGILGLVLGILCQTIRHCSAGQEEGIERCALLLSEDDSRLNPIETAASHGFEGIFSKVFNPMNGDFFPEREANMILKAVKYRLNGNFGIKGMEQINTSESYESINNGLTFLENNNADVFSDSNKEKVKQFCQHCKASNMQSLVERIMNSFFNGNFLIHSMMNIDDETFKKVLINFFNKQNESLKELINEIVFSNNAVPQNVKDLFKNPEGYIRSCILNEDVKFRMLEIIAITEGYIIESQPKIQTKAVSRFPQTSQTNTANVPVDSRFRPLDPLSLDWISTSPPVNTYNLGRTRTRNANFISAIFATAASIEIYSNNGIRNSRMEGVFFTRAINSAFRSLISLDNRFFSAYAIIKQNQEIFRGNNDRLLAEATSNIINIIGGDYLIPEHIIANPIRFGLIRQQVEEFRSNFFRDVDLLVARLYPSTS